MEKAKKTRIRKYASWISLAALVFLLAVMPLLATNEAEAEGPQASILSGTVETAVLTTGIHGGGTLSSQESVEIIIPTGVRITEFLVSNGDTVKAGDALASVDRVSVMSAITGVQETKDYLVEEMADVTSETASSKVTAKPGGLVKAIYAREGDSVQDLMLEYGALAVLSLDGLMAVDLELDTDLTTGDSVTVILEDETEVSGRVDSNMDGLLTVTLEDDNYEIGASVTVTTEDGERLGYGELYVHNAWHAVAYTGTVSQINTEINRNVSSGATLMTLKDTEFNAQLESLLSQYRDYEALMLELFRMYQSTAICAPCDGIISGVDAESVHLLAASGTEYTIALLANAPNGNDEISYTNFVGMVTGVNQGSWSLSMNPQEITITDYTDLSNVPINPASMTVPTPFIPNAPIYELVNGTWVQISAASISAGDILLFACDETGNFVWLVRIVSASVPGETDPTQPPDDTPEPSQPEELPSEPDDPEDPADPDPEDPTFPDDPLDDLFPGGIPGGFFGVTTQEEPFELYDLEGSVLMTVTPQDRMTLSISVDEQDISKIKLGMTADVTITALKNETFTATVTSIGGTGSGNGGSTKFTVDLTMDAREDMLAGMSAVATITLSATEAVPVIPVEALVDDGSKTYVYTGYDEKNDALTGLTEVTLGVSDGIQAEILSGLEEGDSYWYTYYDILELDTSVEPGFGF